VIVPSHDRDHLTPQRRCWRRTGVALGLVAVAAAAATVTVAATAGSGEPPLIHACVSRGLLGLGNGAIRIVEDPSRCRHHEDPLSWNQQGVAGEPGPPGEPGPAGPPGVGLTGFEVVEVHGPAGSESPKAVNAVCPPGKIVLTGGAGVSAAVLGTSIPAFLETSTPLRTVGSEEPTIWHATALEAVPSNEGWQLNVQIFCVDDPTP
jgi:hypothetical protein